MDKYIELNNDKTPKTNFDTFYDSTENLENAGLILDKNIVVVDFDINPEIGEFILENVKTRGIKTRRGYHLYFTIPSDMKIINSTNITTVFGNKVDYKTGYGGKKAYAIVKLNNINREIINPEVTEFPVLPKILYPTSTSEDIINLQPGSRNNTLFKHVLNVSKYLNDGEILLRIAKQINDFMLYPLDLNEIETIVNSAISKIESIDSCYDTDSKGNPKLNMFKLTERIERDLNCTIFNETLYFKYEDKYSKNERILSNIVKNKGFNLTKNQDKELVHQLRKTNKMVHDDFLPIVLANGYCINNGTVGLYKGQFTPYYLDVEYLPSVYDKDVDEFLNWFVSYDAEMRQLINEILGHILMTSGFPQLSFFFVSPKGKNGKSTFFEMLRNFCGELSESLALEELTKAESLSNLRDKLLNCGDDIDDSHIPSSRTFKNLVAGNTIMARELYSNAIPFKNKATLLFSCNEMPKFKDKSGGIERRVRIIPCDNVVVNQDLHIDQKLSTKNAKSYILNLALSGIQSIVNSGGNMILPQRSKISTEEYITESDSVKLYMEYKNEINQSILELSTSVVYMDYEAFCESEGIGAYSKSKFSRRLKEFGYISKVVRTNSNIIRCYIKIENQ
ncbi:phage/plasmid primase, P4 family [Streptobacillus moniliformis]|uniref:phage/plasmid primase, P4 family n=1 Tax=Streptobacillus moniliformis TaxID=34105 RepID=UPI0007E2E1C6|nr:phage/plasmid primase, P4 family [Streptobacillus moniliformis]